MKQFTAKYWNSNPQLKNGGYYTEKTIVARTLKAAQKIANNMNAIYDDLQLISIELA